MAVEITAADRDRIIRDTAKAGKPAPSWVAADPKLQAIYDAAAPTPPGTVPPKKAAGDGGKASTGEKTGGAPRAPAVPAGRPRRARATGGGKKPAASRGRRTRRGGASSPRPAGPIPLPRTLSRAAGGSAAGGLFLAIFLYPIALAIFQNGPAGFGTWLRAKFLNQVSDVPQPTDGGGPLTKIQGPTVPKTGPGSPGYTPSTPPVNQPGVAGQSAPDYSPFQDGWAQMMKQRERVMQ